MHGFAEDRRFDEAADDRHDDIADCDYCCCDIVTLGDEINEHREHGDTDAEYGQEVDQGRYDGKDDRIFAKACCEEYDKRLSRRDDEECEVTAKYTEDKECELVKKSHYPVAEFAAGSVLNEELHYGRTIVDEVETAQDDADYEEYGIREIAYHLPDGREC